MAFYIEILKTAESESEAIYTFYDTAYPDEAGELSLDKQKGTIRMTKPTREAFFQRASHKVTKSFQEGKLPEKLIWAS